MCRDDNGVCRRKKRDAGNIERDRHAGGDARGRLTGIAVPETAGCEIVMVVFGGLSRRCRFARGRVGRRAKAKRMLAEQARQVTVAGSGTQLHRGL